MHRCPPGAPRQPGLWDAARPCGLNLDDSLLDDQDDVVASAERLGEEMRGERDGDEKDRTQSKGGQGWY